MNASFNLESLFIIEFSVKFSTQHKSYFLLWVLNGFAFEPG